MSSTNRGAERVALDAYYTPDAVARACVATIAADVRLRKCWEPHAGGGAFVRALHAADADVIASDIHLLDEEGRHRWPEAEWSAGVDFLHTSETFRPGPRPHWIVGNPPFNEAEAHVRKALDTATIGVAFLLRLAFLESTKRLPFWRENPPAEVYVFARRPSFTGGATDSAAYGWFVWRKGWDREPVLRWLEWSP